MNETETLLRGTTTNTANNVPFLKRLRIGHKLSLGFGLLVILLLGLTSLSFYASSQANATIDSTIQARVPIASLSASAQANLLRMISNVRAYLALGKESGNEHREDFRQSYAQSIQAFMQDMDGLQERTADFTPENQHRFTELQRAFDRWRGNDWVASPEKLFALRDDQLSREPAYKTLTITGTQLAGRILINTNDLIKETESITNSTILADVAKFQGSFAGMFSGLRGYVTTRNRAFRLEYEGNRTLDDVNWSNLLGKRNQLDQNQERIFAKIEEDRKAFLEVPAQIFADLESPRWREDLYLFTNEMLPLANSMQQLLSDMASDDQKQLKIDLDRGRDGLTQANKQMLGGGLFAIFLGITLSYIFRSNIVGPLSRLTQVVDQIRGGNLKAQAQIESGDEIGTLAEIFNSMTTQLRNTLFQVRKEKKRADDLLNVVIPIGVALSSEKDFHRLLETILFEAMSFCRADSGRLFLQEHHTLRCVMLQVISDETRKGLSDTDMPFPTLILQSDDPTKVSFHAAACVARSGETLNIPDVANCREIDHVALQQFAAKTSYESFTLLSMPLKNSQNQVLGVMELENIWDTEADQIIPFDSNLQQMMESFSSLAATALESYAREQALRQEIQQLRIEIDAAKQQSELKEIVDTDFFRELQEKARNLRKRRQE